MNEAYVKGKLSAELSARPAVTVFRHEDHFTSGIPDFSVTGGQSTTWWEVKYAKPFFEEKRIQTLTLRRLNRRGRCGRYIIFEHEGDVFFCHPEDIHDWRSLSYLRIKGFDYVKVAEAILKENGYVGK